ncbi:hypothetical protein GWK47_043313 [Chionoecetes opilio]|uniref:Uncharacterized protein n=1 Tax=Chionoecetes opilio TaxID=41210 RepID=A0A8J4YM31_CHIOP|nr:hypothetical protein GWK47_043313 [Chionoecetes opilio]
MESPLPLRQGGIHGTAVTGILKQHLIQPASHHDHPTAHCMAHYTPFHHNYTTATHSPVTPLCTPMTQGIMHAARTIYVWHTKTKKNRPYSREILGPRYDGTNLRVIQRDIMLQPG